MIVCAGRISPVACLSQPLMQFIDQHPPNSGTPRIPSTLSPNNTGPRELPPAQPALMAYPYSASTRFPATGSGGVTARWPVGLSLRRPIGLAIKLPAAFDHTLFIYDWMRSWILAVKLDSQERIASMKRFLPRPPSSARWTWNSAPDGALYTCWSGARNATAATPTRRLSALITTRTRKHRHAPPGDARGRASQRAAYAPASRSGELS